MILACYPGLYLIYSVVITMDNDEVLWIHLEGKGVIGNRPRIDIMAKYLEALDTLANHVAMFGGHASDEYPLRLFHLYYVKLRTDCAAIGSRFLKSFQARLDKRQDTDRYTKVTHELCDVLVASTTDRGNDQIAKKYPSANHRVMLYNDVKKLCPIEGRTVKITRTGVNQPFNESVFDLSIDEDVKTRVQEWITMESKAGITTLSGYFSGFRMKKSQFWILLEDGTECTCEYVDERLSVVLDKLRAYDHVEVHGNVIIKPEKAPEIKDVKRVVNLDEIAELKADKMSFEEEYGKGFLRGLEEGEKDLKEGRVLSESEFWKRVENDST